MGYGAMYQNTTGSNNSAQGRYALANNTTGNGNSVVGAGALKSNTTGSNNTAAGIAALVNNTSGSGNVGIGDSAGANLTTGSNNIDIGNEGDAGESGIIRIGTATTQTATYIAGIENTKLTGSAVYVTSSGQLGVLASSERYKTAIAPMDASNTEKLKQLRPVSFHLKSDPKGTVQYGLIAEEVNKVYPELVIRDEAGKIQGVRYDELAPMRLNEVQAQAGEIRELKQQQKQFATRSEVTSSSSYRRHWPRCRRRINSSRSVNAGLWDSRPRAGSLLSLNYSEADARDGQVGVGQPLRFVNQHGHVELRSRLALRSPLKRTFITSAYGANRAALASCWRGSGRIGETAHECPQPGVKAFGKINHLR